MTDKEKMEIYEKHTFPWIRNQINFILEKISDKEEWEKELRKTTRLSKKRYQAFLDGEPLTHSETGRLARYLRKCIEERVTKKSKPYQTGIVGTTRIYRMG